MSKKWDVYKVKMPTTIYCLELEGGRYYVGQTPCGRFQKRFEEHLYLGGAKWTTRFKPLRVLWKENVPDEAADEAEEMAVYKIMLKCGRNSVRGGTFNIARDVHARGPRWLKGIYKENWQKITAVSH